MIGKTISHYKIIEKLGEGGMGVVYKAEDTKLKRTVALKFLPRRLDAHEPERSRFLQEAQAASALNHPNICAIHTLGEHEGQEFIDMEFVDGVTLRAKMEGGPLKVEDAIAYAIQTAEALQEAHSKSVVHRDIKPENIMVNSKDHIKVTDFGLAKLKGSLKLTKTSSTVGTLAYMAPEQIEGGEVDARSDIFSFGIVLYEMLAGRRPFRGDQEGAMINSILNDEPEPIQQYRPEVSSELSHIVKRALEKDPEDRYQNVHDMLIDLRRAKKETSRVRRAHRATATTEQHRTALFDEAGPLAEAAPLTGAAARAGRARRPGRVVLMIGLVAAAALAVAAVLIFTPLLPSKRVHALNPNPAIRTLDMPFTNLGMLGLSRDGNWIAFPAWDANNEGSLYFMNVSKGAPKRLLAEHCDDFTYAEISPDNSEVAYDRPAEGNVWGIYVVSSLGGTGRRIATPGMCCMWRPDGERIGYIRGYYRIGGWADINPSVTGKRELWTVKSDGSDNRLEFADSLSLTESFFGFAWSPDGKSIAWLRAFPGYSEIFIHDLASGKERQLTSFKQPILDLTWASNGQVFFSSSKGGNTNIWMIPAKGGAAVPVTKGSGPDLGARVSADGRRLIYLEDREISYLWTADLDGRNARQLTFENQRVSRPKFSHDGKRIAFTVSSDDQLRPGSQIFAINSDGTDRTQVTAGGGVHSSPSWSPDGRAHEAGGELTVFGLRDRVRRAR